MEYLELLGGLILLLVSGEFLVRGGVSIAKRLKISSLVIGMTIVALGTSAPEFIVSLKAALAGSPEIAIGNVIGSNVANIALILGATAVIFPLVVSKNTLRIDWPIMMLASILFFLAASDGLISRSEGIIGFILLVLFIIVQILTSKQDKSEEDNSDNKIYPLWLSILFVIVSCFGLAFGADMLIDSASIIAAKFGVSQRVIGITIVAMGTSLPELVTSIIAAVKKEADIAIGNIIGSNIFNIFCIIGISSIIHPIKFVEGTFDVDMIWMCATALLLLLLMLNYKKKNFFKRGRLGKIGGIVLVASYIAYIFILLI
ncbi:calcium/sodium antiporter [Bacteroidales bacterium OttesenSCG-928-K03]|nr:calcium/sodium antiporter [Odoribacter sp. OttesenSCG-928-L07]MDL2242320.1 calcium/sodium antiporter [Bacteroidales bacterium OttesenSCG-928-K03]